MSEPWLWYFAFDTGRPFRIRGPLGYRGEGRTIQRTDTELVLHLNMPEDRILLHRVPRITADVNITYVNEGAGNRVLIRYKVDETEHPPFDDPAAVVQSSISARRRTITSSKPFWGGIVVASIAYENECQIDLDVSALGRTVDFDLNG